MSNEPRLAEHLSRYTASREAYLRRDPTPLNDQYGFPSRSILRICREWIEEQDVDAVVNPDDDQFTMSGGVSAALRLAGGEQIRAEARRFAPVMPGRAIVTSGGELKARFVFHAVTIDTTRSPDDWILPSRDVINEAIHSCLYHAETLRIRSIAFPLVGTGLGGFPHEVCLDMLFLLLAKRLLHGTSPLREARIVLGRHSESQRWYKNLLKSASPRDAK